LKTNQPKTRPSKQASGRIPLVPHAKEFARQVAVVTGGSEGLGHDLVKALVLLGADVFFALRP